MATSTQLESQKRLPISYSQIAFNVTSGLLLAFLLYLANLLVSYFLIEKGEIYFIDLSRTASGAFQKLIVVDNYSPRPVAKAEFTVASGEIEISSSINIGEVQGLAKGPSNFHIVLKGLDPNRQAVIVIQSKSYIEHSAFRAIDLPAGYEFKSKDRLVDSLFTFDKLFPIVIMFLTYVIGVSLLNIKITKVDEEGRELKERFEALKAEAHRIEDESTKETTKLATRIAEVKIVHVRRIISLSRENEIWREIITKALQSAISSSINSEKIINIFLAKLGVAPTKRLKDLEEEQLIEMIQDSRTSRSSSPSP